MFLKIAKGKKKLLSFTKHQFTYVAFFYKISVLKNFAIFTGNTCVESLPATLVKRDYKTSVFLLILQRNFKVTFLIELLPWSFFFVTID